MWFVANCGCLAFCYCTTKCLTFCTSPKAAHIAALAALTGLTCLRLLAINAEDTEAIFTQIATMPRLAKLSVLTHQRTYHTDTHVNLVQLNAPFVAVKHAHLFALPLTYYRDVGHEGLRGNYAQAAPTQS